MEGKGKRGAGEVQDGKRTRHFVRVVGKDGKVRYPKAERVGNG